MVATNRPISWAQNANILCVHYTRGLVDESVERRLNETTIRESMLTSVRIGVLKGANLPISRYAYKSVMMALASLVCLLNCSEVC